MKIVCSHCFRSLGVGSRARIYTYLLRHKRKNVSEITKFINLRQPTVSYHLKGMVGAGLLGRITVGKKVYYYVNQSCPHDGRECVIR